MGVNRENVEMGAPLAPNPEALADFLWTWGPHSGPVADLDLAFCDGLGFYRWGVTADRDTAVDLSEWAVTNCQRAYGYAGLIVDYREI